MAAFQGRGADVVALRHDPQAGERPGHAERLLLLAHEVLGAADMDFHDLDRIAVGVGPGGFTGLRIGIATARGLAQAHGTSLVGVSSLRALASIDSGVPASRERLVVAVIDARRGEVFAAAWDTAGAPVLPAAAYAPEELCLRVRALHGHSPLVAVGDGALRYRAVLEAAGVAVPSDESDCHRVSGAALCRLGVEGKPIRRDQLVPDYRRDPDAKPPRLP